MFLRVAGIITDSVVDGPGIRYTVFTQGCKHFCKGCHNPQTWDMNGGEELRVRDILKEIKKYPFVRGLTISGGEPFLQAQSCAYLAREVKRRYGFDIITYTGYTYEELLNSNNGDFEELLKATDILIDGPYQDGLKDINIPFRGSANQRIINVQKSLVEGRPIEIYYKAHAI